MNEFWISTILTIVVYATSLAVAWGKINQKISGMEQEQKQIRQEMKDIINTVQELSEAKLDGYKNLVNMRLDKIEGKLDKHNNLVIRLMKVEASANQIISRLNNLEGTSRCNQCNLSENEGED